MDIKTATTTFQALSQATRLSTFRLLVRHEPAGLAAGDIARILDVPHNTLSTHLAILARAGLVTSHRESRSIIYRVCLSQMQLIINFLVEDCCAGHSDVCLPVASFDCSGS